MVLFFIVGIIIVLTSAQPHLPLSSPQRQTTESAKQKSPAKKDFSKLAQSYDQILGKTQAQFAITFFDINSREKLSINGDKTFHVASTTKPIVAAYALKQVDDGKVKLDKQIGVWPLSEHLRLMLNISENQSWEVLINFFGLDNIQNFTRDIGLVKTDQFENTSTADDLAQFLEKIYQGSILSQSSKQFILNLMQNTETEDRIPAGISDKKIVFHKAGSFEGEIHDIGIVAHPTNPFILAILSDGINDLDTRPAVLAEIAKVSWEFVN